MFSSQDNLFPYDNTHIRLGIYLESIPTYKLPLYGRRHISSIPGSCLLMCFWVFGYVLSTLGHILDESCYEDEWYCLVMILSQMVCLSHLSVVFFLVSCVSYFYLLMYPYFYIPSS